jgi:hypothetical protein
VWSMSTVNSEPQGIWRMEKKYAFGESTQEVRGHDKWEMNLDQSCITSCHLRTVHRTHTPFAKINVRKGK